MKTKFIIFLVSLLYAGGLSAQIPPYWFFSTAIDNPNPAGVYGTPPGGLLPTINVSTGDWQVSYNGSGYSPGVYVSDITNPPFWWVWSPESNNGPDSYGWICYPFLSPPADPRPHPTALGLVDIMYKLDFFLPANPLLTVDLDIWADDYVIDVSINGIVTTFPTPPQGQTGQNGNLNQSVKFIACKGWKSNAMNTIIVHSSSQPNGGYAGLMVRSNPPCCGSCNPNHSGPSISNACTNQDFVPKVDPNNNGDLICSQIYDDGTSVGIATTGPFTYSWPGGLTGSNQPAGNGTVKLDVNGVTKALAYFATSDERYKKDIKSISDAMSIINKLDGKTYFWRADEFKDKPFNNRRQYGFIAQELEKVIPEVVATDAKGFKSVNYDMVIPILVQSIKEQQTQIDELKSMVQSLAGNIPNKSGGISGTPVILSDKNTIVLDQNVPNPFAESTVISYNIPTDFVKAQIIFTKADGTVIKSVNITEKGKGTLNVFGNDLTHGMYSYTLVVDGKNIDTKKMVKE